MMKLDQVFQDAAAQFNLDPDLLKSQAMVESSMNPNAIGPKPAVGSERAVGIMQLLPSTAKGLGVDPADPVQSIYGAAQLMRQNLDQYKGNLEHAVSAYHGGTDPKNWGPKTQAYLGKVSDTYRQFKQNGGFTPANQATASSDANDMLAALGDSGGSPTQGRASELLDALSNPAPMPAPVQAKNGVIDTTRDRGVAGNLQDFANATGHNFMAGLHGGAQLIEHGIDSGFQMLPDNPVSRSVHGQVKNDDAAIAKWESDYQKETPDSLGAYGGALTGNLAAVVAAGGPLNKVGTLVENATTNAVSKLPVLGRYAQQAGTVANLAAQGAATAAVSPVTNAAPTVTDLVTGQQPDYWATKRAQVGTGAATGAAVPVVFGAVKGLVNGVRGMVEPVLSPQKVVSRQINEALGPTSPAVIDSLRTAPTYVDGSVPTSAQVAGSPTLVQMEKAAGNTPLVKEALATRGIDNNAARLRALSDAAQSPADLEAAKLARANAVEPLYAAAHAKVVPVDDAFTSLTNRPAMQQAVAKARELAANEGVAVKWPTPEDPTISGKALDYTQRALNDMIDSSMASASPEQMRALNITLGNLSDWAESRIPDLAKAREVYAKASAPINSMEAAQQLKDSLSTGALNAAGDVNPSLTAYRSKLAQVLRKQKYGITPEAQETLDNIQKDLQRETVSNSIRTPGSDTAYNLKADGWMARHVYGPNFEGGGRLVKALGTGAGYLVGGVPGAAGGYVGTDKAASFAQDRLNRAMAQYLLDPSALANALESASREQASKDVSKVIKVLRSPKLTNMLANEAARTTSQP